MPTIALVDDDRNILPSVSIALESEGYRVQTYGEAVPAKGGDGERRVFSGTAADMIADVRALRDLGVGWLDFGYPGSTADEVLASMKRFHNDIISKV